MHRTNPHSFDADKHWEMGRRDVRRSEARLANGLNVIEEARQYHINSMAKEQKRLQKDLLKIQQASFAKKALSSPRQEQAGKPKAKTDGQIKTTAVKGASEEMRTSSESSFNSDQSALELGSSVSLQCRINDFIGTVSKKNKPGAGENLSEDVDQLEDGKFGENEISIPEKLPALAITSNTTLPHSIPAPQSRAQRKDKVVPSMSNVPKQTQPGHTAKPTTSGKATSKHVSTEGPHDLTDQQLHYRRATIQQTKASALETDFSKHSTVPSRYNRTEDESKAAFHYAASHSRQSSLQGPTTTGIADRDLGRNIHLPAQHHRTEEENRAAFLEAQASARRATVSYPSSINLGTSESSRYSITDSTADEENKAALDEAIEYAKQTTGPHPSVLGQQTSDMNVLTFDEEIYAPDGYVRTMHTMPSLEESMDQARKARYVRHRVNPEWNTELSISQVFPHATKKPRDDSSEKDKPK